MIIAGAGGHAIEVLSVLEECKFQDAIYFFDDMNELQGRNIFKHFPVLSTIDEVIKIFSNDPGFIIGVGKPAARKILSDKLLAVGGQWQSIISPYAHIGIHDVELEEGLNIMTGAIITNRISIGKGSLVHIHCSIHHDTVIGAYSELSPGCRILGNVHIGAFVSVGAGAIVLPGVTVGNHAIIGAGAVVTKDVMAGQTVTGVPAKPTK